MNLLNKSKLWQQLLHAMSALLMVCEVRGHSFNASNTYANTSWGDINMDPPSVQPTCGWTILLSSSYPLFNMMVYNTVVDVRNGGLDFYISNISYNGATPTTTTSFKLSATFQGTFGNTVPTYLTLSWYCICAKTTTTAATTTTPSSSAISSSACVVPPNTTTTSSTAATGGQKGEGFLRHAGKCYLSSLEQSDLTYRMLCFYACLISNVCKGVNVEIGSPDRCTFVNPSVIDSSQLTSSDTCDFWEKL
ncbi:integumentary mucin C.1-like isoform X2 [Pomacea canaliculata]|uniref:integumentary mucin C.1-like isoform X2 n=1 Tax=Pomacea canaliculata TaxID=400727 RepID=UPI000D737568|nr:integumentary mucin C.1-like isoform X2 [Pomacea canaliculata]